MARYELDRLFGLALTDARFFRQLCEQPYQAVAQFELTESETQAVARIAPGVATIQELALQLDAWTTGTVIDTPERTLEPAPVLCALPISDRPDGSHREQLHAYRPTSLGVTSRQDEQSLCLKASQYVSRS